MFTLNVTYLDYERLLAARVITLKTLLQPDLEKKAINGLANYCLSIAKNMEEQTEQTNTILVDEINRSCMACAKTGENQAWFSSGNNQCDDLTTSVKYTSLGKGESSVRYQPFDLATDLDFLSYAAVFELFVYVDTKVSKNPTLLKNSDKLPVLHAIHCGDYLDLMERFSNPMWIRLLTTLLANGADANFDYRGRSAWR